MHSVLAFVIGLGCGFMSFMILFFFACRWHDDVVFRDNARRELHDAL